MSKLMAIVDAQGIRVSGSDAGLCGHDIVNVHGCDLVVYTSAVPKDNVELVEAYRLKIPVMERAELLGQIARRCKFVVAIAGSHGKTTTTAMLGAILSEYNALIHVGGDIIGSHTKNKSLTVDSICVHSATSNKEIDAKDDDVNNVDLGELIRNDNALDSGPQVLYKLPVESGGNANTTELDGGHSQQVLPVQAKNNVAHFATLDDYLDNISQHNDYFITEACEYRRSFLCLQPDIAVVLNMSLDHTDYYMGMPDLVNAYGEFVGSARMVVAHKDIVDKIAKHAIIVGVDYRATNVVERYGYIEFDCYEFDSWMCHISIAVFGIHNVDNILASVAVARLLGLSIQEIVDGLSRYKGVKRRFEIIKSDDQGTVVLDYAHHPQEIAGVILTARKFFEHVRVLFQPHTYSRTASLYLEFCNALKLADDIAILPTFASREKYTQGVNAVDLAESVKGKYVSKQDVAQWLKYRQSKDAVVLALGAGDIDQIILTLLESGGQASSAVVYDG